MISFDCFLLFFYNISCNSQNKFLIKYFIKLMSNPSFLSNSDAKLNFNETDSNSLQLLMIGDS